MIRSRLGLKALGMCALVLGLMAVWVGGAQAELTGGKWLYKTPGGVEGEFNATLEPTVNGKFEKETVGILHAEALEKTSILYECTAFSAVGAKLKANGVALGKLRFTGCETFFNGKLEKNCNPEGGTVETNLIEAQMLLHKLESGTIHNILVAEAENEKGELIKNFAVIKSTNLCALGLNVPVGGKFAIEVKNPTTFETEHLIKEFLPLTHLWILSDTTEHKAEILGSALAFLEGTHAGYFVKGDWN